MCDIYEKVFGKGDFNSLRKRKMNFDDLINCPMTELGKTYITYIKDGNEDELLKKLVQPIPGVDHNLDSSMNVDGVKVKRNLEKYRNYIKNSKKYFNAAVVKGKKLNETIDYLYRNIPATIQENKYVNEIKADKERMKERALNRKEAGSKLQAIYRTKEQKSIDLQQFMDKKGQKIEEFQERRDEIFNRRLLTIKENIYNKSSMYREEKDNLRKEKEGKELNHRKMIFMIKYFQTLKVFHK